MSERDNYPFFHELTVQYGELDGQAIVFYGNYLTYFDIAINEYVRATGLDYPAWVAETGLDFNVVRAAIEFRAPLQMGDELRVGVQLARLGRSSLTWLLAIFVGVGTQPAATGEVVWVCADQASFSSRPVPDAIRAKLLSLAERADV